MGNIIKYLASVSVLATSLYSGGLYAVTWVPIMMDDITIMIPVTPPAPPPPPSTVLTDSGVPNPGPITICTGGLTTIEAFYCKYIRKDIYDNYVQKNGGKIPYLTTIDPTWGTIQWTPGFANKVLEYFVSKQYITDANGIPRLTEVRRYVPWSSVVLKPTCNNWGFIVQPIPGCAPGGITRKNILGFGSDKYASDAGDPSNFLPTTALLEIYSVVIELKKNANIISIKNREVVFIAGAVTWEQYGRFDLVRPNMQGAAELYEISNMTIYTPGTSVMLPGSNVSYQDHLYRAHVLADETGKPVIAAYMGQNLCYPFDCWPFSYDQDQFTSELDAVLFHQNKANIAGSATSYVVGESYSGFYVLEAASPYQLFNIVLLAPAMVPWLQFDFQYNLKKSQSPVDIVCGNDDIVTIVGGGCAYKEGILIWGDVGLYNIFNDPTLNVDSFIIDGMGHDLLNLQLEYQW